MKKLLAVVLCMCMVFSAFSPDVSNAMLNYVDIAIPVSESDKVGDVNCNGKIDAEDYILLKRVYFGQYSLGKMLLNFKDSAGKKS